MSIVRGTARRRRRSMLVAAVAALAVGASAPAAVAQVSWQAPQGLSAAENNGERPRVKIADDGSAVAVWRYFDGQSFRVQAAYRRPGENFGEGAFIDGGVNSGAHIRLAMNRRGDAVVVWPAESTRSLSAAYKPAGSATFGRRQEIDGGSGEIGPQIQAPEVAIDGQGRATVVYSRGGLKWSTRAPGAAGTWSAPARVINTRVGPFPPPESGFAPSWTEMAATASLAGNENGELVVSVLSEGMFFAGDPQPRRVDVAALAPGATSWSPAEAPVTDSSLDERTWTAIDAAGQAFVAYRFVRRAGAPAPLITRTYSANFKPKGGPFSAPVLNASELFGAPSSDLAAAFGPGGDLFTLRHGYLGSRPLRQTITPTVTRPPAPLADGMPVSRGDLPRGATPQIAVDGKDNAYALFKQQDGLDAEEVPVDSLQAAYRPAGGAFGEPQPLVTGSLDELDIPPSIAMNASGEAVAAWVRSDGASDRVEVSIGLLPGAPPLPPPPPPPEPPVPSAIQLARPIKAGQAIVLTVKVEGQVSRLRWSFGSKDEPLIFADANQRSVRLRAPSRNFKATVTVVGPGGTREFARTFATPKPPAGENSKAVQRGLERSNAAPVFAVGDAVALTGADDRCGQLTIYSGEQKLAGCFNPVERIGAIPAPERGVLDALARELRLDVADETLMDRAVGLTDGYVATGAALLNDEFPVTPGARASVAAFLQGDALISANASLPVGGGAEYRPPGGFNLDLDPQKATIPLGPLPRPPQLPSIGGFQLVGDWDVSLGQGEALIKASLKLPPWIQAAGVTIQNGITVRATRDRVIVDDATIGPIDANFGALRIDQLKLTYKRAGDEWAGQGRACAVAGLCLDMIPDRGGVRIKDGRLVFAGATLGFPPPGIPLFPLVNLESISFGFGLEPTRMTGGITAGVGSIVKVDGRLLAAFPSPSQPLILDRREIDGYPDRLYGSRYTRPTFGATGTIRAALPVLGDVSLGGGYLLYEYPSYAAFGAHVGLDLLGVISVTGRLDAELDVAEALFNITGSVRACVELGVDICGGAIAAVSRGRGGTGGAGACVEVGPLNIGGGVQWKRVTEPFIWPLDGCKWSRFTAEVRPRGAQAGGGTRITVRRGEPSQAIRLDGPAGPPRVRVSGPSGTLDASEGAGLAYTPDGKLRIVRADGANARFTVVGLQDVRPGSYEITPLPDSPPISRTSVASDPPAARATARVLLGRGPRRTLVYDVRRRPAQAVTFREVSPSGAARRIGRVTGGGRGRLRFTTAPGRGTRRIEAQFELNGMPAEKRVVARLRPPSPLLPRPRGLTVSRRKGKAGLQASWRGVPGASRYEVAATLSTGRQVVASTRRRSLQLRSIPRYAAGRLSVRAVAELRQSPLAQRRFQRSARRQARFRALPRCKVGKRKIVCRQRARRQ